MQDIELRFQTLKDLMRFKQQSEVKELRIDTFEKSLIGRFPAAEVQTAKSFFRATSFQPQQEPATETLK